MNLTTVSSFYIIAVVIALFRNLVQGKDYQYQKFLENSIESNHDHDKVFHEFKTFALEDGSNWAIPQFRNNIYGDLSLCNNNETIRVPVFTNVTTIPCWTRHGGTFNSATDILLYKGTPDTNLTLISGPGRILGYVTENDFGFRYNLTSDPDYLGYYTCFIGNSSGKNYVITELYREDNAASVYSSDCSVEYGINNTGTFFCRVEGNTNTTTFEWRFRTRDGNYISINPHSKTTKKGNFTDGTVWERIKKKLPRSDIVGVECRARETRSCGVVAYWGYLSVVMKESKPEILDNQIESLSLEDGSEFSLNCSFKIDDPSTNSVFWLLNGTKLPDSFHNVTWSKPIGFSILKDRSVTSNTETYTCVVKNGLGFAMKTFSVTRKRGDRVSGQSLYTFGVPVVTSTVLFVLLVIEWKRRTAYLIKFLMKVKILKLQDPSGFSSVVVQDPGNGEPIAKGVHGEVWVTNVRYRNSEKRDKVVLKTFIVTRFLSMNDVDTLFEDLINEIKICQKLNRRNGCPYIVRYMGLYAPSVQRFQVYLVLDYCDPGQLLSFIQTHRENDTIVDDFYENTVEERRRMEREDGYKCLAKTHLLKWAYQIAKAMKFLHDSNIVHRDLASRNILLKALTDDYTSYDGMIAQLADFGLSRFVEETGDYVINEDTSRPRTIPMFWYPPESIGFEPGTPYTKKSDVWSFGVLLWEMFSFGGRPFDIEGYGCSVDVLKRVLERGKRLRREEMGSVPDELWALMEDCWKYDPSERPDFSVICQRLEALNVLFELEQQYGNRG